MNETQSPSGLEPQPPGLQSMRTLFKKYQKVKTNDIDSDDFILDSRKLDGAPGVEPSYLIRSSRLKSVFDEFTTPEDSPEQMALDGAIVYSHKALPGRHMLYLCLLRLSSLIASLFKPLSFQSCFYSGANVLISVRLS